MDSSIRKPIRLDSWKEIAAYLKRGARTVQRWEREEGLPLSLRVGKSTLDTGPGILRNEVWSCSLAR